MSLAFDVQDGNVLQPALQMMMMMMKMMTMMMMTVFIYAQLKYHINNRVKKFSIF